jgi:hypothetical protein
MKIVMNVIGAIGLTCAVMLAAAVLFLVYKPLYDVMCLDQEIVMLERQLKIQELKAELAEAEGGTHDQN